ncbi:zinc finger BED domain-containing protein 4-like [Ornithodoros turicata]|uniref:zinc finger BED domain-containing protein 4-like n=1 Tax=Ornithodoros turicata TaxID=34597 RepID=UPI00313982BA
METPDECPTKKKKRSAVWKYFEESATGGKCKTCGASLQTPTGTTALANHLRRHVLVFKEYQNECQQLKDGTQRKITDTMKRQDTISSRRKEALDAKVARMIAVDLQPFSIVNDRGFRELMTEAVPGYTPPSRTSLSRTIIPKLYDDTRRKVQEELRAAFENGMESISFTSDMWTSCANEAYISLTCHFLDSAYCLKHYHLNTSYVSGRHTAAKIASALEELVAEWSIDTHACPVYIVTDNARNMKAAIRELGWCERSCMAHTLQLVISDAKDCTRGIQELCKKARAVVGHYKHSTQAQG